MEGLAVACETTSCEVTYTQITIKDVSHIQIEIGKDYDSITKDFKSEKKIEELTKEENPSIKFPGLVPNSHQSVRARTVLKNGEGIIGRGPWSDPPEPASTKGIKYNLEKNYIHS